MKKQLFLLFVPLFALLWGCTEGDSDLTTGEPYDILVVVDKPVWESAVGDTIKSIMNEEVVWINRVEPIFDLVHIPHSAVNRTFKRYRNMIVVKIDDTIETPKLTFEDNKWIPGQAMVAVTAKNEQEVANVLSHYKEKIVNYFSEQEMKRFAARAKKFNQDKISEIIEQKFGFDMVIPRGYVNALDTTDMLWLLYEMPVKYQGIVIYSFESEDDNIDILAQRNEFVGVIEGVNENSYMTTDTIFYPETKVEELNGKAWMETRGFWKLENGFMGGPFLNYLTFDEESGKYIGIDMFIFAPKVSDKHRNSVRQMESLMRGVRFNADTQEPTSGDNQQK